MRNGSRLCQVRCRPRRSPREGRSGFSLDLVAPSHAAAPHAHPKSPKSPLPCPNLRPAGPDPPTVPLAPGSARPRPGGVGSLRARVSSILSACSAVRPGKRPEQTRDRGATESPGSRGARRVRSPSLPVTGSGCRRLRDLTPPPKTYLSSRGDRAPAEPARLLTVCAR